MYCFLSFNFPVQLNFHGHIEQPWPLSVGSFSLLVPALGHQPMVPFAGFCWLLLAGVVHA
jgi:hypothetical protein